jgi:hypothetical protein
MNGGFSKVPQLDVNAFWSAFHKVANFHRGCVPNFPEMLLAFDRVISVLFLARWVTLAVAKSRDSTMSPETWLWLQVDKPNLSTNAIERCLLLSDDSLKQLLATLQRECVVSVAVVDEAEANDMLQGQEFFLSLDKRSPRPFGTLVIRWLHEMGKLNSLVVGTNLRLTSFSDYACGTNNVDLDAGFHYLGGFCFAWCCDACTEWSGPDNRGADFTCCGAHLLCT